MLTAVAAAERPVYGVAWGNHSTPLTDYMDLGEASEIARLLKGTVLMRFEPGSWVEL